jgi:hypothetical protein
MPNFKRSKSKDKIIKGLGTKESLPIIQPKQLVQSGLVYLCEEEAENEENEAPPMYRNNEGRRPYTHNNTVQNIQNNGPENIINQGNWKCEKKIIRIQGI